MHTRITTTAYPSRLIPAHAGNTEDAVADSGGYSGSSPRTRGIQDISSVSVLYDGLIPAHAGNTGSGCAIRGHLPAHPRTRGEYPERAFSRVLAAGSSPRMRGIRMLFSGAGSELGLIPAHAGNT